MSLASWAKTDIGLVRSSNQDAVGCFPERGLFVVADGMGGHANGELASRMAVDVLRSEIGVPCEPGPADLEAAVRAANEQIFEAGHRDRSSGLPAMGTTIVALALGQRAEALRGQSVWIGQGIAIQIQLPDDRQYLCLQAVDRAPFRA